MICGEIGKWYFTNIIKKLAMYASFSNPESCYFNRNSAILLVAISTDG
jgi:hypothetical protein